MRCLSLVYLKCIHIKKSFGAVIALEDATLSVEKGEIHAILGGNGSGKSTLARTIGGSVFPDGGEIWVDGKKVNIGSPIQSKKLGIVVTSQELSLFNNLTVEKNLSLSDKPGLLHIFRNKKQSVSKAKKLLKKFDLEEILYKDVSSLPENVKYLVEFAKAIQSNPKILIIDEITSALFRDDVLKVKEILNEMAQDGCAVIFISHRLQEIYSICSKVTVMRNGRIVDTHTIDVSEDQLISEMIGEAAGKSYALCKESDLECLNKTNDSNQKLLSLTDYRISGFDNKLNFEMNKGEMICIAGLQGQGQSQFLRSLFGINSHSNIYIDGAKTRIDSPRDAIKSGISYLSGERQKEGVFNGRSINENITVVNSQILFKNFFDVNSLLEKFGVKYKSTTQEIQTLSGGNQQKVITARWVGVKPKLILADDPTKGIDVVARKEVHGIFADLVNDGTSIIMSSSDDEEIVLMSEIIPRYRVFVFYNGQIVTVLQGKDISISNIISSSIPRGAKHE